VAPHGTTQWLRETGIRPRKAWGQNFLVNPRVAARLVAGWGLAPGACLLEIGAGAGSITLPLLQRGVRVVAVERDPALAELLRRRAEAECAEGDLRILTADILTVEGREILAAGPAGDWHLAGNLPYSITTPILEWAGRQRASFAWASFMVQREYGERLLAPPGGEAYGALTLWAAYRFAMRRELTVGSANFWPRPTVESVVVRLVPHARPPVEVPGEEALRAVVRAAFGQRRKVIGGALAAGLCLPRERVERALAEAGIGSRRRGEECDLAQFAALTRALHAPEGGA
jgi:16S rRNA (adenine1518-N6/adenine1519-N6)-dimethyltransferase